MNRSPQTKSVRLRCFWCALVAGWLAWLMLSTSGSIAGAAEKPDAAAATSSRYEMREDHDPNGIGKFYLGREIARVMSYHGAPWLERPEREEEERLSLLVESLKLKPGMQVADIGAGSGVISMMMAERVGPEGTIYAVDIQQEMLDLLAVKLDRAGVENIRLVLGDVKSPRLPDETIDLAIFVDVYHEFEFPFEMMQAIAASLRVGGRLALVEYRMEDPAVPIKLVHKMTAAQVRRELEQPGLPFVWKETIGTLPRQHIVVFEKVAPAGK